MRFWPDQDHDRREFFRGAARYGLLGLLALVAAVSGQTIGPKRQRCINRGICSGCLAFTDCELPQALSAKNARFEATWEKSRG